MTAIANFDTDFISAADGTRIGYQQLGTGPGLILVHGALQSSLNFTEMAKALSAYFTVYVPDRRGRGLSGPYGAHDDRLTEANDILALAQATGTRNIFGLSSGAIISLQAALLQPVFKKIALYEPPIPLNENTFKKLDVDYEQAIREGNTGKAFAAILKGTGDTSFMSRLPNFLLAPVFNWMMKAQLKQKNGNEVPLRQLIFNFRQDRIVIQGSAQLIRQAEGLDAEILLLHGAESKPFLKQPLDQLAAVLPHATRFEFKKQSHLAADNSGSPLEVAERLRHFFNTRI